jgi:hypothetical protein
MIIQKYVYNFCDWRYIHTYVIHVNAYTHILYRYIYMHIYIYMCIHMYTHRYECLHIVKCTRLYGMDTHFEVNLTSLIQTMLNLWVHTHVWNYDSV